MTRCPIRIRTLWMPIGSFSAVIDSTPFASTRPVRSRTKISADGAAAWTIRVRVSESGEGDMDLLLLSVHLEKLGKSGCFLAQLVTERREHHYPIRPVHCVNLIGLGVLLPDQLDRLSSQSRLGREVDYDLH